jgi:hypothetical protein
VPTFEVLPRFLRDHEALTKRDTEAFERSVELFGAGLRAGTFDPRLRVKRVQSTADVWEMSWAPDGRATFRYGEEVFPGEPHSVWRRVGHHSILDRNP